MIKYNYILVAILVLMFSANSNAQNSPQTKIRLFEQTTVFDSVVNKNDSLYIYAGDTVFKAKISDADWYEVGTTSAPNSINDNIFTQGNVGIGTPNPGLKLHTRINDLSYNVGFGDVVMESNFGAFSSVLAFYSGAKAEGAYPFTRDSMTSTIQSSGTTIRNLAFATGNTEKMRILANGNVGIGITIPTNQLHIAGGTNPIRTEGLQPATVNDSAVLVVDPVNGTVRYLDLDSIGGSDNDWYKIGTTSAPNDISDSIFTGGDVQITNYPNTRADDTTTHLNVLYTDVAGNIKSARREINPPAVALNVSTVNSGNTFNYYNHYATQMTNVGLNPILVGSLDFYVLYYDTAIFANVSISPVGVLSYDVISTSASHAVIDVRFYTK